MRRPLALALLLLTALPAWGQDFAGQGSPAAKQALEKSTNPQVRAFAETMQRDHAAVNQQALALVTRLHVTPEANPTSTSLSDAAAA